MCPILDEVPHETESKMSPCRFSHNDDVRGVDPDVLYEVPIPRNGVEESSGERIWFFAL